MVRSEKTRQFIIEKTASIFNKKGYVGTYLSDLTEATGLSKGSIYGNFKDKNEVALEAFRYNFKLQKQEVKRRMENENHAITKLLIFLDHFKIEYVNVFENGGCAILNTAVDADDGNIELKKEVVLKIKEWIKEIVTILDHGITKGEVKQIDTKGTAHKMIALIEGSILLAKTLERPKILIENIDLLEKEVLSLRMG